MKILKHFLLLIIIFVLAVPSSFADDASVMSELQKNLKPSGWDTTKSYCSWNSKQIKCDSSGRVTELNLAQLSLSGTLPSDLNQLTNLQQLALQGNSLTGEIPSLANMSNLQSVYLDNNNFSSIAAGAFDGLSSLLNLSLTGNSQLAPWTLPSSLSQASTLQRLEAGSANVMGSIPDIFGSLTNLNSLRLSYNNLTGSLPPSFAGSGIKNLWLNNQVHGLSGTLDVLGSMEQLSQAWLHVNSFSGGIPDLSNCTSLYDLQLRDNQLTGIVPTSLTSLKSLTSVSLMNNKLMGPVPVFTNNGIFSIGQWNTSNDFCKEQGPCDPEVTALLNVAGALGYPENLVSSWQGNNACSNWGAITCDSGTNVTSVTFAKRGFVGYISPAFSDLSMLKYLYLNDNNLTGPIPESLTTLSHLQTLDVSNNNLTGPLPKFPATLTKFNISGNPYINTTVSPNGSPSGSGSTSPSGSPSGSSPSAGAIAGIVVGVLVCLGLLLFVSYRLYAKKKHEKFGKVGGSDDGKDVMSNGKPGPLNLFNGVPSELHSQSSAGNSEFQVFEGGNVVIQIQVLRQVTNNFSEDNILGRGGFGVVYKGELHDGTQIAVKRMESNDMGNKGLNEFKAEIGVLTKVRHRHLVALLGYCINGNERLLVYEYMPQGHLGQHLFDYKNLGYAPLTWKQRVTTALDVARGVEYLHSLARESFIHRDLKPSNILLGDDMRAKVSDFGLVKNAPDGKYSLETKLAGTFGYLAPEYAATGRVTTKVDVYAFGVILMELITGRRALDDTQPEERAHLVTWFRRVLISKEDISNIIDPTLRPDEDTLDSIKKVAELAGHCTAREAYQRPDMGHAVNVLGPLVEQWKPSCQEEDETYGIDLHLSLPQALQRWQDEGTSTMASGFYHTRTESQSSIPDQPSEFNTFNSSKAR